MLLDELKEEEKREVLGMLVDFLVGVTYGEGQNEIISYLQTFHEIAPEAAAVFSPLDYVGDYLKAVSKGKTSGKTDKIAEMKRAEIALDRCRRNLWKPSKK